MKPVFIREHHDATTYIRVCPEDVVMVQADGDTSLIWLVESNVPIETYMLLQDIHKLFPAFIRCHKSYIINPDYIWKVNTKEDWVMLKGNQMRASIAQSAKHPYRLSITKLLKNNQ